jgi:hypothetical protein
MDAPTLVFTFDKKKLYQRYCVHTKSTCLAKDLAFLYKCTVINIPKLVGRCLTMQLSSRKKHMTDNSLHFKEATQQDFKL